MWDKYYFRQNITLDRLFVLFIFCNPTDNFDVGVDGWVFMLADSGDMFVVVGHPGRLLW
jgi:hypothetical protein